MSMRRATTTAQAAMHAGDWTVRKDRQALRRILEELGISVGEYEHLYQAKGIALKAVRALRKVTP